MTKPHSGLSMLVFKAVVSSAIASSYCWLIMEAPALLKCWSNSSGAWSPAGESAEPLALETAFRTAPSAPPVLSCDRKSLLAWNSSPRNSISATISIGRASPATRARSSLLRRGRGEVFASRFEPKAIQTNRIVNERIIFFCVKSSSSFSRGKQWLLAGEALEVGHLALHFLAGGVGGGADALNAQLEFVGIGGAREGFIQGDELLGVEIEERLIERLHAVLAGAGGDGVVDQSRLVRVDDAVADVPGGDHDFDGGNAALVILAAHQALRNDGLQSGGKLQTNLLLLGRGEDRDNTLNCFRGVESVQSGKNQVAGFGGEQRGGNGFEVAHFADQNHVGVLTQGGAQRGGKVRGVHFDFALIDEALLIAVEKFDGVFDGDQVFGAVGVDAVDHRRQRGGLTGTGGSGNQHQPALFFANFGDDGGKVQFVRGANFRRDDAQHHADVAALLKDVDAEAAEAGNAIGHIQFRRFLELLLLSVGHHAEGHRKHLFGRDARHVGERGKQAVHAQVRMIADFQVQVGRFVFDRAAEKIVNADSHVV